MNPPFNPLTRQSQIYSPLDSIESPKEYPKESLESKESLERTALYQILHNDGFAIRFISPELITFEHCKIATSLTPTAILFIPYKFITLEMLLAALKCDPFIGYLLPPEIVLPLIQEYHASNPFAISHYSYYLSRPPYLKGGDECGDECGDDDSRDDTFDW